jgi:hypothetical protein
MRYAGSAHNPGYRVAHPGYIPTVPDGQISQILSSLIAKNILLSSLGKSVI